MQFLVKSESDIELLLQEKISESISLDYKRDLPEVEKRGPKIEFLADVCSFANTQGGQIIFGVDEKKLDAVSGGEPDAVPSGVPGIAIDNQDKFFTQLHNIIRTGIEPRLSGVNVKLIDYHSKKILVLTIPQSWNSPHWISFENKFKFYGREPKGNFLLSHQQIRDKFIMTASVADRMNQFRTERVERIMQNDTPIRLDAGPKLVFHIVPFSSFTSDVVVDVIQIRRLCMDNFDLFLPLGGNNLNQDITLEGLLVNSGVRSGIARTYTHFYRNGIIESVATIPNGSSNGVQGDMQVIASGSYEEYIMRQRYLEVLQKLDFAPPYYLFVSLVGVRHFGLQRVLKGRHSQVESSRRDYLYDNILLRPAVLDSYEFSQASMYKKVFDQLCNAWGFDERLNFDSNGEYIYR